MEIALLPKQSLRIKGKKSTFIVNPQEKLDGYNAALYFSDITSFDSEVVKIAGAGEYEVAGVKISGTRADTGIVYSLNVDEMDFLIGDLKTLDKLQHKLKEHTVVVVLTQEVGSAAFIPSLAVSGVIFYGDKAAEVVHALAKENVQEVNKVQFIHDKLPAEMQTILLA